MVGMGLPWEVEPPSCWVRKTLEPGKPWVPTEVGTREGASDEDTLRSPALGPDASEKRQALALTTGAGGTVGSEAVLGVYVLGPALLCTFQVPCECPPCHGSVLMKLGMTHLAGPTGESISGKWWPRSGPQGEHSPGCGRRMSSEAPSSCPPLSFTLCTG